MCEVAAKAALAAETLHEILTECSFELEIEAGKEGGRLLQLIH